ncbi:MAG: sigma 54-interacting transcriptional regulator [Candidatus Sabulitectum sp.]|nr:sigma 54-interacting transcriptional regulator [Candidatus Sabulitectum sp.]
MAGTSSIISRKHISSGRMEILFKDNSDRLRLGRIFSSGEETGVVKKMLRMISAIKVDSILVPDRCDTDIEEGKFCFSMPWDPLWDSSGIWKTEELIAPLRALHEEGWLHLDITPASYRNVNGKLKLLVWGDALIAGLACVPPELSAGAAPTPFSDYYMLGRAMMASRGYLWDGSNPSTVEALVAEQISHRAKALRKAGLPGTTLQSGNFKCNKVNILAGGKWQERDLITGNWVTKAGSDGWLVSVVRCNPIETMRPLPGREAPVEKINSGAALVNNLFPSMSGVERLLVIDQIEFASPDLFEIIREFTNLLPPGLTVIVTAAELPDRLKECDLSVVNLAGEVSVAWDIPLPLLPSKALGSGYPSFGFQGAMYRCTAAGDPPEPSQINPETLFAEGGYRALVAAASIDQSGLDTGLIAKAHFELGNFDEALHFTPDSDILLRARILLAMGRPGEVTELLAEKQSNEEKVLKASALIDLMDLEMAVDLLKDVPGAESALLLAKALDLQGRVAEALPEIEKALAFAGEPSRVKLLCSKAVIFMRIGDYRHALDAAECSVITAKKLADAALLGKSLTERGRVREVMGNWSGAVDDYRLALLYYAENPGKTDRPPLIDLFVLELRTGELKSAVSTFKSLGIRLEQSGSGIPADQMTEMLAAYRGVLLGLGAMRIPSARRSASMAAGKNLTLVHALSLLYLGQLLLQEGKNEEGLEALKYARAKAGFMGDRHLALLADLAMTRVGAEIDTSRLLWEARELGLRPEELEAEIISSDDPAVRDRAFLDILNMPAPLLACELASSFGLPEEPGIRRRILESFKDISELLNDVERKQFARLNSRLVRILENLSGFSDMSVLSNSIKKISQWYGKATVGLKDLNSLGEELGLLYLGPAPSGKSDELQISSLPDLFAIGPDLSSVKLLAPLIAAISGASPILAVDEHIRGYNLFPEIIGQSDIVMKLKSIMKRVAQMPVPVLITGDTGTGKELVARGLHDEGPRAKGPFIAVDCGAIAETLLESELFGVTRGAFTGASESRIGLMEAANGGTLFLDEIGNMSAGLQVKLLRVLETGKLRRLGDTSERETSFRLITATNADLRQNSASGKFRTDLYYRIAVIDIKVPPLRERMDDIALLVEHFTSELRGEIQFSRDAINAMIKYNWPGNIRELRNVVQRTVLMCQGKIVRADDVSIGEGFHKDSTFRMEPLEIAIVRHVSSVVDCCDGNRLKASRILQCDPKTVRKYLALKK